jgi:tetratricopeptide (TPR) repeat protein
MLDDAVEEANLAAKFFATAGDLYHAATAAGFIGDLYRETGDFEAAQAAFRRFHELATKWGDRNLIQIADLTEAWVALDVGDLTSAQRRITAVEKDLSATASRRLRRYLAAAKALLEVGRGHWELAAELMPRVVEIWDASGPRTVADMLRA